MSCTHRELGRYEPQVVDWWTEEEQLVWVEGASTQVDISLGAFRCTKCGEVGYYTGNWKRYYEEGVPCAGSNSVSRKLPNNLVTKN